MSKAARYSLAATVGFVAVFIQALVWLKTPPGAARLLPECDAVLYANIKPLRSVTHFDRTPVSRAAEYQAFVDATGVVPERDLDAVALAMHHMDDARGPNGPMAYSEVFEGRFDSGRLERYLASIAVARESYAGKTIFSIQVGEVTGPNGRRLRVAVLERGLIVASNAPTTEQIHAMLDRGRHGPSLLAGYGEIPWFASAWGIGRLGLPLGEGGWVTAGGLRLPFRDDTEFLASVRYLGGGVTLRVEALAGSELDAAHIAQQVSPLLTLVKAVVENQPGLRAGPSRAVLDSVIVAATGNRVLLNAVIPVALLRELTTAGSNQAPR